MRRAFAAAIVVSSVALVAACGDAGSDAAAQVVAPTSFGACGSLFLHATEPDASAAVTLAIDLPRQGDLREELTLPDPRVSAEVVTGRAVDDPFCNDMVGAEHRVDRTFRIASGTVVVERSGQQVVARFRGLRARGEDAPEVRLNAIVTNIGPEGG